MGNTFGKHLGKIIYSACDLARRSSLSAGDNGLKTCTEGHAEEGGCGNISLFDVIIFGPSDSVSDSTMFDVFNLTNRRSICMINTSKCPFSTEVETRKSL